LGEATGIKPIWDKFLEDNFVFAMRWRGGANKPDVFLFGRVINAMILDYKPWKLIDANGNAVDIEPSTHQGELWFRDPRNTKNDIIYLDTAVSPAGWPWFLHGSFGLEPEPIRMYPRFPLGQGERPGQWPNIEAVNPAQNDHFGYIDSLRSPYEEPTNYREFVVPPRLKIGAEYYNTDDEERIQPIIHILFCKYEFQVLTPDDHAATIREIATRPGRPKFFTVGFGDQPLAPPVEVMNAWLGEPKARRVELMTLEEAAALG